MEDDGDVLQGAGGIDGLFGVSLSRLKADYLAIKDQKQTLKHRELLQAMVTYQHLGKRDINVFLREAHPGKNKKALANALDYGLTVGGIARYLQPGAGAVTLVEEQQAVAAFEEEQRAKRARRESEALANRRVSQQLRRLSDNLRRLWDEGWADIMRPLLLEEDGFVRRGMIEVLECAATRELFRQKLSETGDSDPREVVLYVRELPLAQFLLREHYFAVCLRELDNDMRQHLRVCWECLSACVSERLCYLSDSEFQWPRSQGPGRRRGLSRAL